MVSTNVIINMWKANIKNELFDERSSIFTFIANFIETMTIIVTPINTVIGKMEWWKIFRNPIMRKSQIPNLHNNFEISIAFVLCFCINNCRYPPIEKNTNPRISNSSNGITTNNATNKSMYHPAKRFNRM